MGFTGFIEFGAIVVKVVKVHFGDLLSALGTSPMNNQN